MRPPRSWVEWAAWTVPAGVVVAAALAFMLHGRGAEKYLPKWTLFGPKRPVVEVTVIEVNRKTLDGERVSPRIAPEYVVDGKPVKLADLARTLSGRPAPVIRAEGSTAWAHMLDLIRECIKAGIDRFEFALAEPGAPDGRPLCCTLLKASELQGPGKKVYVNVAETPQGELNLSVNGAPLPGTTDAEKLDALAKMLRILKDNCDAFPSVLIGAEVSTPYRRIYAVMDVCDKIGLLRLAGFVLPKDWPDTPPASSVVPKPVERTVN